MSDEELDGALALISDGRPRSSDPGRAVAVPDHSAITDYDNQLIADLVANLRPAADILGHYGLTQEDVAAKSRNPEWAARYRQIAAQWNSDQNLRERIRAKAAFLLEDSLVPLMKIIGGTATHAAKLEAIEKLIKISTVAHVPKDEGHQVEQRRIILNIGAGVGPITVVSESENERTAVGILPAQAPGNREGVSQWERDRRAGLPNGQPGEPPAAARHHVNGELHAAGHADPVAARSGSEPGQANQGATEPDRSVPVAATRRTRKTRKSAGSPQVREEAGG